MCPSVFSTSTLQYEQRERLFVLQPFRNLSSKTVFVVVVVLVYAQSLQMRWPLLPYTLFFPLIKSLETVFLSHRTSPLSFSLRLRTLPPLPLRPLNPRISSCIVSMPTAPPGEMSRFPTNQPPLHLKRHPQTRDFFGLTFVKSMHGGFR